MKIGSKSRRDFNLSLASNGRSAAVFGVLLDGLLRKKRDCSYSRMITIHGVPNS